jgi:methyl-accepting chemotaxis protein
MTKNLSLTAKLMTVVGVLLTSFAVIFMSLSYFSLLSTRDNINNQVSEEIKEQINQSVSAKASNYAAQTETLINRAHTVPKTLSSILVASIENNGQLSLTRDQVELITGNILTDSPTSSIYAQFEQNKFDGLASQFSAGASHSTNSAGSFEIYFVRDNDGSINQVGIEDHTVKLDETLDEFGFRTAEWYLCNKDNLKPCISNPYQYEIRPGYSELMTSLTVPVIANGTFRGVVGADLNLPILQERAVALKNSLYNGKSQVFLVSQNGLLIAASDHENRLARPFNEVFDDKTFTDTVLSLSDSGEAYINNNTLYVVRPVSLPLAGIEWKLVVGIDVLEAMAPVTAVKQEIANSISGLLISQFIVAILATLIGIGLIYVFTTSIVKPVKQVALRMQELAGQGGDLTQDITVNSHAELMMLSDAFNQFREKVRSLLEQAKLSCAEVIEHSAQTQKQASQTREQVDRQQQEIDSVVSAITQMASSASSVSTTATDAASNADHANASVKETEKQVQAATHTVQTLSHEMVSATSAVKAVSERSGEIEQILDVIGAIADQTNLLALNAAIEAARAGENGRGFSVVADEVRSLASKTAKSVGEISHVIQALQSEVDKTVDIIGNGTQKADGAAQSSSAAFDKMKDTASQINEISSRMTNMATAAKEQSQVSEELTKNMYIIGDATKEVANLSQSSEQSSHQIYASVNSLSELLSKLKTH